MNDYLPGHVTVVNNFLAWLRGCYVRRFEEYVRSILNSLFWRLLTPPEDRNFSGEIIRYPAIRK